MDQNLEQINQDIPPHVQRMVNEYRELHEKCEKLAAFIVDKGPIYEKLADEDKTLLDLQLQHMENYKNILTIRIERALGGK